jgi:hypothetical protein
MIFQEHHAIPNACTKVTFHSLNLHNSMSHLEQMNFQKHHAISRFITQEWLLRTWIYHKLMMSKQVNNSLRLSCNYKICTHTWFFSKTCNYKSHELSIWVIIQKTWTQTWVEISILHGTHLSLINLMIWKSFLLNFFNVFMSS